MSGESKILEAAEPPVSRACESLMARDIPPWLVLLMARQFETNCLASVAIEVPELRPMLGRRARDV